MIYFMKDKDNKRSFSRAYWSVVNNFGLKKLEKIEHDGKSLMVGICECHYYYRFVFHDGENFQP